MSKFRRTNPNIISSPDDSLLILPFDLILEILSRLPVKSLLQVRCVCKSWTSLISDPKFVKKHLNLSTMRRFYHVSRDNPSSNFILNSYSLQSIFTDTYNNFTKLEFPLNISSEWHTHRVVGSCDGILCVANYRFSCYFEPLAVLWNPSIRKCKALPPFEKPLVKSFVVTLGFGYDLVSHDYKVVVFYRAFSNNGSLEDTINAKVYTLNSDSWRSIQQFPPFGTLCNYQPGIYVSGAINWLVFSTPGFQRIIVSFDLGKESYQKILLHEHEEISDCLKLCVLRDWLCIISDHDVWVMKDYGVKESWTKLFNVSSLLDPSSQSFKLTNILYIFENDQVLLMFKKNSERRSIVYSFKNDTSKVTFMFQDISKSKVYVESLISPCS